MSDLDASSEPAESSTPAPAAPPPPLLADALREQRLATLYRAHADMLCAVADQLLTRYGQALHAVTAADLVHDAFALFLAGERDAILLQGDDATCKYLVGVLKHTVQDHCNIAERRATLTTADVADLGDASSPPPDVLYTTEELQRLVQRVVETAPAREPASAGIFFISFSRNVL